MKKLSKTIPPKRGPNPQGLKTKGFKKGADVNLFLRGDQDFAFGSGDLSYTFEKKKIDLTPKKIKKQTKKEESNGFKTKDRNMAFDYDIKTLKIKPFITGSGYKPYKKSIKAQADRIGLDTSYNTKKFDLNTRYSQNVHGEKNKRFKADLSYRPNEKTQIDFETDADKRHFASLAFAPNKKLDIDISSDLDRRHNFGFDYRGKKTKFSARTDADQDHSFFGSYSPNKNLNFTGSYSGHRGYRIGADLRFSKGGSSGCPHRETGVKSDIKGVKDIQVKGKKFIGVK
tara:strand:+ start:8332 stop:9186 length:855 start_codon:yes stop_codon:yes gene_type:complete